MLEQTLPLAGEMAWYIPILIFFARIFDVSIGTVRIILVVGGHGLVAAVLGFVEVIIWVLAVAGALAFMPNPFALIGYAGGYSVGVLMGMALEKRIALGYRVVRAISADQSAHLSKALRERGYRVTRLQGEGRDGPVEIAFSITRRRYLDPLRDAIHEIDPKAFISISQAERPEQATFGTNSRFGRTTWKKGLGLRK